MKLIKLAGYVAAATFLTACFDSDDDDDNDPSVPAINMEYAEKVMVSNAKIALNAYTDSLTTAQALQTALATFRTTPNAANLQAAKKAWLVAREPYGQTEVYRFRPTPIEDDLSTSDDDADGPEGALNAWPLGEALIDYVKTSTDFGTGEIGVESHNVPVENGGTAIADAITATNASDGTNNLTNTIIGNPDVTINAALLETSESGAGNDVISGYHAIEFLLWGQDLNTTDQSATDGTDRDEAVNTGTGGGQRPLSDFVSTTANDAADRRHEFLEVAAAKLVADLQQVVNQWTPNTTDSYYDDFVTLTDEADAKLKLTEILTGMGTLSEGELAGERMQIAFSSNSQEDEHSCFSDNTHRDVWLNAEGVSNAFYGTYAGYDSTLNGTDDVTTNAVTGDDSYGIYDYLKDVGLDTVAEEAKAKLAETETNYTAIDTEARDNNKPFDVLIMEANRTAADNPVGLTIQSLNAQSVAIQDIATALGLGDVVADDGTACDTQNPLTECPDGE